jgi:hypothetical protein
MPDCTRTFMSSFQSPLSSALSSRPQAQGKERWALTHVDKRDQVLVGKRGEQGGSVRTNILSRKRETTSHFRLGPLVPLFFLLFFLARPLCSPFAPPAFSMIKVCPHRLTDSPPTAICLFALTPFSHIQLLTVTGNTTRWRCQESHSGMTPTRHGTLDLKMKWQSESSCQE